MARYSGPVLAAGAIGNALGDMFKGMAEGEERMPQVANAWQALNAAKQQYAHNEQMNPLRVAQLQGSNTHQGVQTELSREELVNRPLLRQREGAAEQRAVDQHGWAGNAERRAGDQHGWAGQEAQRAGERHDWAGSEAKRAGERHGWAGNQETRTAEQYQRGLAAQKALADFAARNGGRIDFSNPQQLQAFNAILAEHGSHLGQHPITQEGLKHVGPPSSPDAAIARLLQRDPSTLNPQETALVKQYNDSQQATIRANQALANQRDSRAGYWQSKKLGGAPIETDKLEKHWADLNKNAENGVRLVLRDNLGIQTPKELGATLEEKFAALAWAKKLYLAEALEMRPMLKEYIEDQMGGAFPSMMELRANPPQHLRDKGSNGTFAWLWNLFNRDTPQSNIQTAPPAVHRTQDGWTIEQID